MCGELIDFLGTLSLCPFAPLYCYWWWAWTGSAGRVRTILPPWATRKVWVGVNRTEKNLQFKAVLRKVLQIKFPLARCSAPSVLARFIAPVLSTLAGPPINAPLIGLRPPAFHRLSIWPSYFITSWQPFPDCLWIIMAIAKLSWYYVW